MKLYLVCLLVALSYVSAAPAPEQKQGGGDAKPMEKLFHEILKVSKVLTRSMDKGFKEIEHEAEQAGKPIEKLFEEMLHIGKKLGETFDSLAKDFEKRAGIKEPESQESRLDGKNPFVQE